ncbi:hypothetical protein LRR18_05395 [Mangrovimonas sp. AS39]|uniref:hypothetical protein n=1 Tax=Mangrovimonas futianensis TaxID=2895523 RepID=UPI001E3FC385|nr:hypothetical protein [Mangrovimonas futianensis]MCF1191012.1 hypothetical protein [Mangrovimonas futianensis]MCF1194707.1 hypothetical protein [Mangrovimonas futianensis]
MNLTQNNAKKKKVKILGFIILLIGIITQFAFQGKIIDMVASMLIGGGIGLLVGAWVGKKQETSN